MYSDSILKKIPLIAIAIAAVALVAVGPTFSINSAAAAVVKVARGQAVFSGTGSITCPDGSKVTDLTASFNAFKNSKTGQIGGSYFIFPPGQSGDISQANISPNNFKFIGIGAPVCPSANFGLTKISMDGPCASDVTVQYKGANGEAGTLGPVNVQCTG